MTYGEKIDTAILVHLAIWSTMDRRNLYFRKAK